MEEQHIVTTDSGAPAPSTDYSLTVGPDGPIVLHDYYLFEQMANFNREPIPERQPHAKGSGAFGYFETTKDVSHWTKAQLFQPNTKTPMVARFSTVASNKGTPDTWRDLRGFALRFYTQEGIYDLVANNTPIFFVRDPMKFQHFIRSQKGRQDNGLRDRDMQWDFWVHSPESAHQVTWLFGDRGIPRTWRHMNGYGGNTFMWVNENNERFWIKYHIKTDQGIDYISDEEAIRITGQDLDYHYRDLYNAIARGDFPTWTLCVQVMPYEDAKTYYLNPFDVTKVWPHGDYPLHEVGRMTLNRNLLDYHTEMEQLAFEPDNLVPGIGLSPDKMLQARAISYADQHRYRLGVNYKQIPVNRPINPVHAYSRAGVMRIDNSGDPMYWPNSKGGPLPKSQRENVEEKFEATGELVRAPNTLREGDDDYTQARNLINKVMGVDERARLVKNVVSHISLDVQEPTLKKVFQYWKNIDEDTGQLIEEGLRAIKTLSF